MDVSCLTTPYIMHDESDITLQLPVRNDKRNETKTKTEERNGDENGGNAETKTA